MKRLLHSRRPRVVVWAGILLCLTLLLSIGIGIFLLSRSTSAPRPTRTMPITQKTEQPATTKHQANGPSAPAKPTTPVFDKTSHSTTNAASLWVVVNKQHSLSPLQYSPSDLVMGNGAYYSSRLKTDLASLITAAAQQNVALTVASAYRSYMTQASTYNNYVASYGQMTADTISARPGYSEHQTGLAIDIGSSSQPSCNFSECFGNTKEGIWLAAHMAEYGFILRYPKNMITVTGYAYEPWHIRYIGREAAAQYKKEGASTLEQFFNVNGGATYS